MSDETNEAIGPDIIGPFNRGDQYELTYEGRKIPYFYAGHADKEKPEDWYLFFDNRISFGPMSDETLRQILGPLAYGMAFAAGYACPYAETKYNPFATRMVGLQTERPKPHLTVVSPQEQP